MFLVNEFRQNIREELEKVFEFSQQLKNNRKFKLTADEIEYFGFTKPEELALPELETFKNPQFPQVFEK